MSAQTNAPYPVHRLVSTRMIEQGINPTAHPYAAMLEALLGYEHGNASLTNVQLGDSLQKTLTAEQYGAALLDLAYSIEYTRNVDPTDSVEDAITTLLAAYKVSDESRVPIRHAFKCILMAHGV